MSIPQKDILQVLFQGNDNYYKKLKDKRWKDKAKEVVRNANCICSSCKRSGVVVQVHHNFYDQGRDPWDYKEWELRVLCRDCHQSFHEELQVFKRDVLPKLDVYSLQIVNRAWPILLKDNKPLLVAYAMVALASRQGLLEHLALECQKETQPRTTT